MIFIIFFNSILILCAYYSLLTSCGHHCITEEFIHLTYQSVTFRFSSLFSYSLDWVVAVSARRYFTHDSCGLEESVKFPWLSSHLYFWQSNYDHRTWVGPSRSKRLKEKLRERDSLFSRARCRNSVLNLTTMNNVIWYCYSRLRWWQAWKTWDMKQERRGPVSWQKATPCY